MKVSSFVSAKRYTPPKRDAKIEFAIPSEGGNSSAGEKRNFSEKAVRLAWWNPDGNFDPISSAEMPEWAILDVVEACAEKDFFSPQQASLLIIELAKSIERQLA